MSESCEHDIRYPVEMQHRCYGKKQYREQNHHIEWAAQRDIEVF